MEIITTVSFTTGVGALEGDSGKYDTGVLDKNTKLTKVKA